MDTAADSMYSRARALAARYSEANVSRIVALLEEAAAVEHVGALYELANWRHYGIGAPRDDVAAARLWERAALRGHAEARFSLAIACERGIGVDRDQARAFTLYERNARGGDPNAIYEIGRCRYYGIGTLLDRRAAGVDFKRARRLGHFEAICDDAELDAPRRMPRPSAAGPFHPTRGG